MNENAMGHQNIVMITIKHLQINEILALNNS